MAVKRKGIPPEKEKTEKKQQDFSKQQILTAAQYASRKDLLDALLEEGKRYTKIEVEELMKQFMKGKVN